MRLGTGNGSKHPSGRISAPAAEALVIFAAFSGSAILRLPQTRTKKPPADRPPLKTLGRGQDRRVCKRFLP